MKTWSIPLLITCLTACENTPLKPAAETKLPTGVQFIEQVR
ncbi:MAG: hypothetical protein ACI93V_000333, partial [Alteromonadaceae bacterium]